MRTRIMLIGAFTAAIFVAGFAIGQVAGIGQSSAATTHKPANPWATLGPRPDFGRWHPFGGAFGHRIGSGSAAAGKVTSVNGNSLTISPTAPFRGPSGTKTTVTTVTLTGSSTISKGWGQTASLASIKTGTFIVASGTLSSDGKSLSATRVMILPHAPARGPHIMGLGQHADGTVTSVAGGTVTLKPDETSAGIPSDEYTKVTTLTISGTTTIQAGPGQSATAATIKKGDYVVATGTVSSTGASLAATRVLVLGSGAVHAHGWGPGMVRPFGHGPFDGPGPQTTRPIGWR